MGKRDFSKKPSNNEWPAATMNNRTYIQFYNRLKALAISSFQWLNLPPTIDERYLELSLYEYGMAVFFKDPVIGYLGLRAIIGGPLDVYRIPIKRTAYADNGYNMPLDNTDSVLIYNDVLHVNSVMDAQLYALRLYDIQRSIDVNVRAQKTPLLILADKDQLLTMKNLYMQIDGNEPAIFGSDKLALDNIKSVNTTAPYVADKLQGQLDKTWNSALTNMGISNFAQEKKERIISDEVDSYMGAVNAAKFTKLNERKAACRKINEMFGLNIDVEYREDIQMLEKMKEEISIQMSAANAEEQGDKGE